MTQDVLDTMIGSREAAADPKAAEAHYETAMELERDGERVAAIDALTVSRQILRHCCNMAVDFAGQRHCANPEGAAQLSGADGGQVALGLARCRGMTRAPDE